jgi:hypothetical protein
VQNETLGCAQKPINEKTPPHRFDGAASISVAFAAYTAVSAEFAVYAASVSSFFDDMR